MQKVEYQNIEHTKRYFTLMCEPWGVYHEYFWKFIILDNYEVLVTQKYNGKMYLLHNHLIKLRHFGIAKVQITKLCTELQDFLCWLNCWL